MTAFRRLLACVAGVLATVLAVPAYAGGPNIVNGAGQPVAWPGGVAPFNPDRGGLGTMSNGTATARLVSDAQVWTDVSTSTVVMSNAGQLPVDVNVNNYPTYFGICGDGLSPVIYDNDGSITDDVYGIGARDHIIGFAAINCGTYVPPEVTEGLAVLNGRFLDGVDNATNPELTADEFDAVMIHEFGHYLGLDHSQVGLAQAFDGNPSNDAALATMFPILVNGTAMGTLHLDDVVAISAIYPAPSFATSFATVTGSVFLADGTTPFQGANVVARLLTDPFETAVSQVSGARYAIGPAGGPPPPALRGLYELAGLPAGDYTIEIESVHPNFVGGSAVGPLSPPIAVPGPAEFWNGANEAGTDPPDVTADVESVTVSVGVVTSGIDVLVNEYPPPANDECVAATEVAATPFTDTIQASGATRGAFDPLQSCTGVAPGQNEDSVWYRYVPPADGVVSADTLGSTYDTILSAHGGSCGGFSELACNDNAVSSAQSAISVVVSAGVPIYLEVTARSSGATLQFALDFVPSAACAASPVGGCRTSVALGQSPIKIRDAGDPASRQLLWKWGKGVSTTLAEFGAPLTSIGTSYAFCLYDGGGTLVAAATIPAGGQCGSSGKDCWRGSTKTFKYRDSDRTPDGIKSLDLGAGGDGKARIGLKGAGSLLPAVPLPLTPPLTAQLSRSGGTCWEARYSPAAIQRNDGVQLKAKDD